MLILKQCKEVKFESFRIKKKIGRFLGRKIVEQLNFLEAYFLILEAYFHFQEV